MPAYDYQCRACQERFIKQETIAEHSRGGTVACPKCQSADVERVIAAAYPRTPRKS
jgi:putative FmdB family regulatory protein